MVRVLLTLFIALSFTFTTGCEKPANAPSKPSESVPPEPSLGEPQNSTSTAPAEVSSSTGSITKPDSPKEPVSIPDPAKARIPGREAIYHELPNGEQLIADAIKTAQREHKNVLIEWGGNWCGWCYKLHDVFHKDSAVQPIVFEEYVLVLIDQGKNMDLLKHYDTSTVDFGYPHLTILDAEGKLLTNQETGALESGKHHDPKVVADFLTKWKPEAQDAQTLLTTALEQAKINKKKILLRVGTPYCGWCKVLSKFIDDYKDLFAKDYVDLKIDTMRMTNGEDVAKRFLPGDSLGVPWFVILDADAKTLATSVGSGGNIGYPYKPEEIAHFVSMLRTTRTNLTDEDLVIISTAMNTYRKTREAKTDTPAAERATIYSVESVAGSLKDETATVTAKGTVTSGGWSNPDLHAVTYIQPPPDGIWDYTFTAQRPSGIATMALAPIETSPITIENAKSKKGIRVATNENSFTLRFLQETQSVPKPVDSVTIKSAKTEGNTLVLDVSYTGGDHDNHEFELHWNGISTRSMPPQMNFLLTHKAQGDTAKAIIEKPIYFALPATIAPAVIRIRSTEDGEPTEIKLEAPTH